jgi:hypothetical protein
VVTHHLLLAEMIRRNLVISSSSQNTGIAGKLVNKLERKVFDTQEEGKAFMDEWMASPGINVSRTVYHGSANFIGNMVTRLLKNLDDLQIKLHQHLSEDNWSLACLYVKDFKQFSAVLGSCFGKTKDFVDSVINPSYFFIVKK